MSLKLLSSPARRLLPLVLSLTLVGLAHAAPSVEAIPGLSTDGFDPKVRAQDDLFRAVNGEWLSKTAIPADKSRYGSFTLLADLSDKRLRTIADELLAKPQKPGSTDQKVADFYRAFLDTDHLDKAGLQPVQGELAGIAALKTPADLARWFGENQGVHDTPIGLGVQGDFKEPTRYTVLTWQAGLGLPDRDYYLKDDDRYVKVRAAYLAYLTQLGELAGDKHAAETAKSVIALERRIAEVHWSKVDLRDPVKIYNAMTPAELAQSAPGLDWPAFLAAAQLKNVDRLSNSQPSTTAAIAKMASEVPMAQWRDYLRLHVLDESANLLGKQFRDARFAFRGTALSGTKEQKPRWQQGVDELNGAMGEALGKVYVERYFPAANKARMEQLVASLLATYKESIDGLTWMSPETKAAAQAKLAKYRTKIGYPDKFRDYDTLSVKAGDAVGNHNRAGRFEWLRNAVRAGKPVDRSEWGMTPQTINAYYDPSFNEIVFPAAILQPPFFDMSADDAVNYGAIGAAIGHEISHGFDDEGSQFDGDGKLANWWTDADRKAFEAVTTKLVAQYDGYEPIPGKHVNGKLTLGENIADLSGLQIAFKAYKRTLGGKPSPVIGGTTGEQRFFMAWAQVWRDKIREERSMQLLTVDPHSPAAVRADGAAVNHDGFHEAFQTKPGDKMYKAPEERIRLW
ncbi:MAG TPA: M13 family metallopeptidase [Burkholderiaceae bacterium]|jgi:putative endopeptidase